MITLAKFEGGSRAYGLSTPSSDLDLRWVFAHTDLGRVIGLDRYEHESQKTEETDDNFGYELRFFFNLLKKGNTQCIEMLFNDTWIEKLPVFDLIQSYKWKLIDSEKLFKVLLGYLNGEKRIITGQNSGKLGEKRKEQLEKYGYSYRNCVHALRLARTGILFFKDNIYPVNIVKDDKYLGLFIRDVKINPQNYRVENLICLIEDLEFLLKQAFDNRAETYYFNGKIANELIWLVYRDIIRDYKPKIVYVP